MLKSIILLKRKPGLSVEEFSEYWSTRHAPIIAGLPGISRHVQNHVTPGARGGVPPFDGIAEGWYENRSELEKLLASETYQRMLADEPNFVDRDATISMLVREVETRI